MNDFDAFFSDHPMFVINHNTLDIWDVNDCAVSFYGYSKKEFRLMNMNDLGSKLRRTDLIKPTNGQNGSSDKIWRHQTQEGEDRYIQFTTHMFSHRGKPARLAVGHDVTELVEKKEQNANKFPQFQHPTSERNFAEIVWNPDKSVKEWSEKAEDLFGWSEDEVTGSSHFFDSFIYEDELEQARQRVNHTADSLLESYSVEGRNYTKDGKVRVCEWYNTMIYDENDQLNSIFSLVHDITERKATEQLFEALAEKSLVGIYLMQNNRFIYVNPHFASIFGYEKSEIEQKLSPQDLTHPGDWEMIEKKLTAPLNGQDTFIRYDFRGLSKNGSKKLIKVFGNRISYLGEPAIVGTMLDVTSSKMTLKKYQASVESFEILFDSISDAIFILDKEGKFIKVNEAAMELSGYDREFLLGNTNDALNAPGKVDLEVSREYFDKALQGSSQHFEQWGKRKSGEVFPKEVFLKPGTYKGKNVVISINRDMTDRYEVEDEIKKSRQKFQQLFKNAPVGIVMMDKHQEIRTLNKAFEDIFGYSEEEIEGLDIDLLIVPEHEEQNAREFSENIFGGGAFSTTATRKRKDGSPVEVIISGVPVNVNNQTIAIFGIYVDITERKQAEERIKESLKEKEVLLAEIHHRVKNNLAVITGLLELQQYNTEDAKAKGILRESQLRIKSIALIHEKLYQNENLSEISIQSYLKELVDIVVSSMETDETNVDILIESDKIDLTINQAIPCGLILNELITNSYNHAFEHAEGGEIAIKLKEEEGFIKLIYKDNGCGFPQNVSLMKPESLGLTLIRTLSRQVEGSYGFEKPAEGMEFRLNFELQE